MQTNFAPEPEIEVTLRSNRGNDGFPVRILYAEDNDDVRDVAAASLRQAGYEVVTVDDGAKAWEELNLRNFDLLITDNEMPRVTGLELIAKAQREDMELDVILASGAVGQLRGPALGTVHLRARLQKPFTRAELLDAVKNALELGADCEEFKSREFLASHL